MIQFDGCIFFKWVGWNHLCRGWMSWEFWVFWALSFEVAHGASGKLMMGRFVIVILLMEEIPAPVVMVNRSLFSGFYTCQVVQDCFHQQYVNMLFFVWQLLLWAQRRWFSMQCMVYLGGEEHVPSCFVQFPLQHSSNHLHAKWMEDPLGANANPKIHTLQDSKQFLRKKLSWARCGRKSESSWRRRRKWWSLGSSADGRR